MARKTVRIVKRPKKMENQANASVMNVSAIVEEEIVNVIEEETMIEIGTGIVIATESVMIVVGGKEVEVGVCLAFLIAGTPHLVGIGIEIEKGEGIVTEIEIIDARAGVGGVLVVTVVA